MTVYRYLGDRWTRSDLRGASARRSGARTESASGAETARCSVEFTNGQRHIVLGRLLRKGSG